MVSDKQRQGWGADAQLFAVVSKLTSQLSASAPTLSSVQQREGCCSWSNGIIMMNLQLLPVQSCSWVTGLQPLFYHKRNKQFCDVGLMQIHTCHHSQCCCPSRGVVEARQTPLHATPAEVKEVKNTLTGKLWTFKQLWHCVWFLMLLNNGEWELQSKGWHFK